MSALFASSYGYVIFPKITKAGLVMGGSGGYGRYMNMANPLARQKWHRYPSAHRLVPKAYHEVIFLENKEVLDRFKDNKVEFSAEISAVAVKSGASENAKYTDGVSVFTMILAD